MHVLVIQTAFIGDAILASALLEGLHARAEVRSVSLLVRKGNHGLFTGHPYLKRLHVLDKSLPKIKQLWGMISEIRSQHYDVVINLQRFMATGIIATLSGAGVRIGFDKNPLSRLFTHRIAHQIGDGRHEVERALDTLRPLFGPVSARPRLYPSAADFASTRHERPYICMAPSSVWYTKQWPVDNWTELISTIPLQYDIMLLGAPVDRDLCEGLRTRFPDRNVLNRCGELTLLQSTALMSSAKMNYVNDSAPLHLCSAMDAPVTAIFCSTVPSFGFGPLSTVQYTIESKHELDCRPCGLHGKRACPLGHFKCAEMDLKNFPRLGE